MEKAGCSERLGTTLNQKNQSHHCTDWKHCLSRNIFLPLWSFQSGNSTENHHKDFFCRKESWFFSFLSLSFFPLWQQGSQPEFLLYLIFPVVYWNIIMLCKYSVYNMMNRHILSVNKRWGGWRDGSAAKSVCCSPSGYEFGSRHPLWAARTHLDLQLQENSTLLSSTGICTHVQYPHADVYLTKPIFF